MRCLALDVGDERIGVAISDETGWLARPLETLRRVAGPSSFRRLGEIIRDHQVELVVVGWPLLEDGSEGSQVRSTRAYVDGLRRHIGVPVVYWDERYSSRRAEELVREATGPRRSGKRRGHSLDSVAAAVILQEYLDAQAMEKLG